MPVPQEHVKQLKVDLQSHQEELTELRQESIEKCEAVHTPKEFS